MKPITRLLVNTLSQYARTILNVLLSLYSTRLVLESLGSGDYGIYTLVAGVVSMLYFITNALSSTTQRYLSFYQNRSEKSLGILRGYVVNSLVIHICLGVFLSLCMIGLMFYLFDGFLNINSNRLFAAKIVYIAMVLMLLVALVTAPCRAILLSHENIVFISIIDVLEGILKLLIACCVSVISGDRLIWYGCLMVGVSFFNFFAFYFYVIHCYRECTKLNLSYLSKSKIKELISFACWTTYGTLCIFGRVQGIAMVLNKFFGTVINAAYGISLQINAALGAVSAALLTAIKPQVIAAEGEGERDKMLRLSETGCKLGFLLLSVFAIPILFNMQNLLSLWLGKVPTNTSFFCSVIIIGTLFDQATVGYSASIQAVGNIKNYTIVIDTLKFFTTFLIAILLYVGVNIHWAFGSYAIIEIIGSILCLVFCKLNVGLSFRKYIVNVVLRLIAPFSLYCIIWYFGSYVNFSLWMFILQFIFFFSVYACAIFFISLRNSERMVISNMFFSFFYKVNILFKNNE